MPFVPDPQPGDLSAALPAESGVSHFMPDPTEFGTPTTPETQAPERPPGPGSRSGTLASAKIAPWLADALSGLGVEGSVLKNDLVSGSVNQMPLLPGGLDPNTFGGAAGGIATPAIYGALRGSPGGPMGMLLGAGGALIGQAGQDLLRTGTIDPLRTGIQTAMGGIAPGIAKVLEGAGIAGSGILRNLGILPDIKAAAMASPEMMPVGPLNSAANTLISGTSNPEAQRVADFIQSKLGNTPASPATVAKGGPVTQAWVNQYLAGLGGGKPAALPTTVSMKDYQIVRDEIGNLTNKLGMNQAPVNDAYSQMMEGLRQAAASGNQAAADLLRNAQEVNVLKDITPSKTGLGLSGATGYGLWALTHRPAYVAAATGGPLAFNTLRGLGAAGSYNPYLSGPAGMLTQEAIQSILGGGGQP